MPRYSYCCTSCATEHEADRPIAARHDGPPCSNCGAPTALTLSAPLVVFKGAGWTTPTTTDKLRRRAAEHATRGHAGPLRATRSPLARAPGSRLPSEPPASSAAENEEKTT